MTARFAAYSQAALVACLLIPSLAQAQSSLTGVVRDPSGAVMAGVAVTASSPALIEKSRTVTSDGAGRYDIIDLRPGTYSVSVMMPGFKTFKQDNIDVPASAAVTVPVEMTVGAVGDTITVEANAVSVDIENATHQQTLTRAIQDSIPAPRNMQALGGLTPGVQLHSASGGNPDVGGSQQMEQTYIVAHGSGAVHTTVLLDGMNINSNYIDGTIQNYVDNGIIQQATYQTSGISAETSAGGVLVNQIPKDGGNSFHGDGFFSGTGSGGWWQASNITKALTDRGVTTSDSIVKIEDFNVTAGGPIIKNKLWFLSSGRYQSTYDTAAGVVYPNGSPGVEEQWIKQGVLRLSWQISSKDKFSGTYDRIQKHKGHELKPLALRPDNPDVSASQRGPTMYYVAQGKWTRIQTPRLLFDAGFSTDVIHYSVIYQPGQQEAIGPIDPVTGFVQPLPANIAHVSKQDAVLGIRSNAPPMQNYYLPDRRNFSASSTYVNGSHNIKFGIQDAFGKNDQVTSMNGDLYENFSNGVPTTVTIYNTPLAIRQHVNADLGIFVTDTWHYKRLALTGGVRWEYEKSTIDASAINAGRFVTARSFPEVNCDNLKGLGCWKTWAPRFGAVYDLFGNGKTAVKFGFGKYYAPRFTGYLQAFNPMALQSDTRTWTDKDLKGANLPTNGDGIAQENEIGPSANPNFGKAANVPGLDPNNSREFNRQFSAGVQHQVRNGTTVSFNWFRRTNHDALYTRNNAVTAADWTPISIINPLDGSTITAYNLNKAKFGLPAQNFVTNVDPKLYGNVYTGYEFGFSTRLPHRGTLFGGVTIERDTDINCTQQTGGFGNTSGNNWPGSTLDDPNSLRFCDESGMIPFRPEFKLAGNFPLWKGFELSMTFQNDPEFQKYVNWTLTANSVYPVDCVNCPAGQRVFPAAGQPGALTNTSLFVPLVAPGTRYYDRLNQLDLGVKRTFVIREKLRVQAQLDVFNVTNSNTVLVEVQTLGTTAGTSIKALANGGPGGLPTQILQARLLRLAVQFHF